MSKFEGGEEMGTEGGEEEMGMEAPEPPQPEGEMAEEDDFMSEKEKKNLVASFFTEEDDMEDDYPRHRKPGGSRASSKLKHRGIKDEEANRMEEMIEGLFGESKVEKVLTKYFKIDEKERLMMEEKKKEKNIETEKTNKTRQRIKSLSESISQEVASAKLVKKYPNAKLVGKNKNNKCLVFEVQNKTLKVTPKGSIL